MIAYSLHYIPHKLYIKERDRNFHEFYKEIRNKKDAYLACYMKAYPVTEQSVGGLLFFAVCKHPKCQPPDL